jgi:hypothetical protein
MSESSTTRPEKEFAIGRGSKIAVWLNAHGRTVTISPPRFKDQQGNWRDGGFFMNEVPMLIYALQQAMAYCYATPVPSNENDPTT